MPRFTAATPTEGGTMSTASGSAAGDAAGATATAFEHHWFKEPTEPAPRKYVVWLLIATAITPVA